MAMVGRPVGGKILGLARFRAARLPKFLRGQNETWGAPKERAFMAGREPLSTTVKKEHQGHPQGGKFLGVARYSTAGVHRFLRVQNQKGFFEAGERVVNGRRGCLLNCPPVHGLKDVSCIHSLCKRQEQMEL